MNFNLVEMYNGLLRFNKHILNELAEGLKHLPNLDGVSKGDSLIINEQGNPAWGSTAFIPTFENAAYGIEWTKDDNDIIRIGNVYRGILNFFGDIWTFIRDIVVINKDKDYNAVYLLKKGVNHSDVTKDNVNEKCYLIGHQANTNNFITEFDFQRGVYFIPNKVGNNKKADYNWIRGSNGQDTDKAVRVLRLGGGADNGSTAGSGDFNSAWVRSDSGAYVGFFTTVKLD